MADPAALLQANGLHNAGLIVAAAAGAGLELAVFAALIEGESHGRNVWGSDRTPTPDAQLPYTKGGPVTAENYRAYLERRDVDGYQGCGPGQLTLKDYQDLADRRGGCHDPTVNLATSAEIFADLLRVSGGDVHTAFRRYRGYGLPAAVPYADRAMTRVQKWRNLMAPAYYLLTHPNPHGQHYYPTRTKPLLAYVVHITAGLQDLDGVDDQSAEATARYCATTEREVSWHAGTDTDSTVLLLPPSYTAWHVGGYNSPTYGHEISKLHIRWGEMPAEWVEATLRQAARHAATIARQYGIPVRHATRAELDRAIATGATTPVGFIEHSVLDPTRRSDPGADFPWARFLELVQHYLDNGDTGGDDMSAAAEEGIRQLVDVFDDYYAAHQAKYGTGKHIGQGLFEIEEAMGEVYTATGKTIGGALVQLLTDVTEVKARPAGGGQAEPIDYDQLAQALLRQLAAAAGSAPTAE